MLLGRLNLALSLWRGNNGRGNNASLLERKDEIMAKAKKDPLAILGTPAERAARIERNTVAYDAAIEREHEAHYLATLKLSADSREELRRCDVDRVVTAAASLGWGPAFCLWLAKGELKPETREELREIAAEIGCVVS